MRGLIYRPLRVVDWELIVLSFAPSAAAVWHCDLVRITCERKSVRHSVFVPALGIAFFFQRWAGQFVIIIHEFEFKADATAATQDQTFALDV